MSFMVVSEASSILMHESNPRGITFFPEHGHGKRSNGPLVNSFNVHSSFFFSRLFAGDFFRGEALIPGEKKITAKIDIIISYHELL